MSSFASMGDALGPVVGRLGLRAKVLEQRLMQAWPEIVGPQVALHTRPDAIRYKKLYVVADNSVWVQQLSFLKPDLLHKIGHAVGPDQVTDLILRVGDPSDFAALPPAPPGPPARPQPSQELIDEASVRAQSIGDDELRRRFIAVMTGALARARQDRGPVL